MSEPRSAEERHGTVLVIDDTEANRYVVARHLQRAGYVVHQAANGREGITAAQRELPDLITLDVRMPDLTGFEVARHLRTDARTAAIPILHISASFTDSGSMAAGLDNGADGYLTHPVDPPVLIATVRALLRARQAEQAAQAVALEWQATFDAIGEGVCVTDAGGRVTRCNRAFDEMVLHGGGSPLRRRIVDLVPGLTVTTEPPLVRLADSGAAAGRLKLGERWLRVSSVPLAAADGDAAGAICVLADITRERLIDERSRQALQLESTGRLAGGVAHEINNMMTVILAYSDFALRDLAPEDPARHNLEGIHKAARRSADVARQLLTFSRRQIVHPRVIDAHALIRGVEGMVRRLLGADRILRLELTARNTWVVFDPLGLEQLLVNLALNARDAMPQGGELRIRTADVELGAAMAERYPEITIRQGRYLEIAVIDAGHGMDDETLARVFEPFFTTKAVGEGTGLGLATVYGMVKQADGYIWATSEPGMGARFAVQLPLVAAPPSPTPVPPPPARGSGHETVLVVEDEPMVRELVSRSLHDMGYRVEEAVDGAEALDVMERAAGEIAVIVTDVIMPRMGGQELAAEVRKRWPGVAVLFMSGYTSDEVVGRGMLALEEAFLQKPFAPEVLAARVRDLIAATRR